MSGLYPIIKAKGKVLWEGNQFFQLPPHFHNKVIEFWLQILLYTIAKQCGEPPEHNYSVLVRKTQLLQVLNSGNEVGFNAAGQKRGTISNVLNADGTQEEVESGSELPVDAAG